MDSKIIISISVIITIAIVGFSLTQMEITETQTSPTIEESNPIQGMLNQIKQDKTAKSRRSHVNV